ncbi:MAG TPA: hypothetical protein ENK32_06625 [Anaerolineae bacterium]|nr:hypothetical protein [Anaerolineae bacterium]
MKQSYVWLSLWAFWLAAGLWPAPARAEGATALRLRLRYADGTAVAGERVVLERLPEEEPVLPVCETDANGECVWYVGRGLYQLLFTRPLDPVSRLATAEGGLTGFGVTVGDEAITYHFTFHSDGRVYFDAAPEAAVPSPIIPEPEALHSGAAPTPALAGELVEATPIPEPTSAPDTAVAATAGSPWRLILFIGGGLAIGGGLHFWSQKRRKTDEKTTRLPDDKTARLPDDQTTQLPDDKTTRLPTEETKDA